MEHVFLLHRASGSSFGHLPCRLPLTRPEMALGLLVEVAYEHDEEFRQHLPQVTDPARTLVLVVSCYAV